MQTLATTPIPARPAAAGGWLAAAGIALLAVAVYAPALRAGFVWDDVTVTSNHLLKSARGLWQIWFEPRAQTYEAHYWPLTYTTFWVEHQLFGLDARAHHATNVLLHALNAVLVFRLARRLALPGAWLAGALFAVHPVHVESVAWIVERKDVLSFALTFAALLAYERFHRERRWLSWLLALGAFALAMLSKGVALGLPLVLAAGVWWRAGRLGWRELLPIVPFVAVAVGLALPDVLYSYDRDPVPFAHGPLERALLVGQAFWFYAWKLAWPGELMAIYPRWSPDVAAPAAWLATAALAGLFLLLVARVRRWGRGPLVVFLFYAVFLAPTLGFLDFYFMTYSYVADRFQYLASAGPLLGAAWLLARPAAVAERVPRRARLAAAGVAVVALAALCVRQAAVWRDDESLFGHNVARNDEAWLAWTNLGNAYLEQERLEEALEAHLRAVQLEGSYAKGHYNLGVTFNELGRHEEARVALQRALEIEPRYPKALNNLGYALDKLGRPREALKHYVLATSIDQHSYEAFYNLGMTLAQVDQVDRAYGAFLRATELRPDSADAHYMLGETLLHLGWYDDARTSYERVLECDPDHPGARRRLEELEGVDTTGGMKHVVLISLDTTRTDHLGCYGSADVETPRIDGLAAEGVRFEDVSTAATTTLAAHTSLMTGLWPHTHGVARNGYVVHGENVMLAETLAERGFRTVGVAGAVALHQRLDFHQGFEVWDQDFGATPAGLALSERDAAAVTEAALGAVDALDGPGRLFLFVHYADPHLPYAPPEPWRSMYGPVPEHVSGGHEDVRDARARHEQAVGLDGVQETRSHQLAPELVRGSARAPLGDDEALARLYAGEVSYMDHHVGRLLDGLRERGLLDEALVVLTGDHGETFWEHGDVWNHGLAVYQTTVRQPLIVRLPGAARAGGVVAQPVSLVDVAPTILELLGIEAPAETEGRSLVPLIAGESLPSRPLYSSGPGAWGPLEEDTEVWVNERKAHCIREGRWKYVWTPYLELEELYDLAADPGEQEDLLHEPGPGHRAQADGLRERLLAWMASADPRESRSILEDPSDVLERSRAARREQRERAEMLRQLQELGCAGDVDHDSEEDGE